MQAAISIAKQAEERKEEIENSRNLPTDLMTQAKEHSLPRMWVAKKYGGSQQSVEAVMKIWLPTFGVKSVPWPGSSSQWGGFENFQSLLFVLRL
ncbi:MAG: hypothetical protein AAF655_28070, partial [Bacteroidota bacterium]